MNAIVTRAKNDIKEMADILAAYPAPEKWTQKQKAQAVQFAVLLDTAQKVIKAKTIAGIDWQKENKTFLSNAGRTQSTHTRTAYRAALHRLEVWTDRQAEHQPT